MNASDEALVREALARLGQPLLFGSVSRLPSFTNRVFRVNGPDDIVVRIPGPAPRSRSRLEAEAHNAAAAAAASIGPAVIGFDLSDGTMATRYIEGAHPKPVIRDIGIVARTLRTLHSLSISFRFTFDAFTGISSFAARSTRPSPGLDDLLGRVSDVAQALDSAERVLVPCHNDPWPDNAVLLADKCLLVDWEYSAMGDPAWDLADYSVEAGLDTGQRETMLEAYCDGHVDSGLRDRVVMLEPITDVFWGLWSMDQDDSGNDSVDFRAYAEQRFAAARSRFDGNRP